MPGSCRAGGRVLSVLSRAQSRVGQTSSGRRKVAGYSATANEPRVQAERSIRYNYVGGSSGWLVSVRILRRYEPFYNYNVYKMLYDLYISSIMFVCVYILDQITPGLK